MRSAVRFRATMGMLAPASRKGNTGMRVLRARFAVRRCRALSPIWPPSMPSCGLCRCLSFRCATKGKRECGRGCGCARETLSQPHTRNSHTFRFKAQSAGWGHREKGRGMLGEEEREHTDG